MTLTCDLFCRVVDNLGDAGVCWRLGWQLAREHAWSMRLWIDDLAPLAALRPGVDPALTQQTIDGVAIHRWTADFPDVLPGDVVVEAFACELPAGFLVAMAAKPRLPVWLNLEYLSAEEWVVGCHGLPSPHPTLPLAKYFFFPGFVPGTGGLIRDASLPVPKRQTPSRELRISLFCYDNPALPGLLDAWASGTTAMVCRVADGLARSQVERWLGVSFPVDTKLQRGNLKLVALPFLSQEQYDQLLLDCDLNFVRGEDSFVRAQFAIRAFVWQAYPQDGNAQWLKLDAFLDRYTRSLPTAERNAVVTFWRAWNGRGDINVAWAAFLDAIPRLKAHGAKWSAQIAEHGNLAENLVRFSQERL